MAVDLGVAALPRKSLTVPGPLEQVASRLSSRAAAEGLHASRPELPDLKGEWLAGPGTPGSTGILLGSSAARRVGSQGPASRADPWTQHRSRRRASLVALCSVVVSL